MKSLFRLPGEEQLIEEYDQYYLPMNGQFNHGMETYENTDVAHGSMVPASVKPEQGKSKLSNIVANLAADDDDQEDYENMKEMKPPRPDSSQDYENTAHFKKTLKH